MSKYRKIIQLFLCVLITTNVFSQLNLVPNPSFENADSSFLKGDCGWFDSIVINWFSPEHFNDHVGSADYWSNKSIIPWMKPWDQEPFSGNAYVGFVLINDLLSFDYRENIETKFVEPLKKNIKYEVKMHYVYSVLTSNFDSIYTLGLHFSDTIIRSEFDSLTMWFHPLTVKPQLEFEIKNPIDSIHWKEEVSTFVAKGGEQYLTIGSFEDITVIPYDIYLYLDDISVIPIYPANAGDSKKLCKGDSILIGDNNYTEYEYYWFKKGSADTLSKQGQIWVKPDTTTTYILHQTYNKSYPSSDTITIDVHYNYCHKENNLKVYPNPGNGQFLFEFKNPIAGNVEIEVFDVIGRKMKDLRFESNDYRANFTVNMVGFGSGVYSYRLSNGENHFSGRLMVVK